MWGLSHRKTQKKSADQRLSGHLQSSIKWKEMEFKLFRQRNGATNACSDLNMWWISMTYEQLFGFCRRNYGGFTLQKNKHLLVKLWFVPPEWRLSYLLKQVDLCVHAHTNTGRQPFSPLRFQYLRFQAPHWVPIKREQRKYFTAFFLHLHCFFKVPQIIKP